MKISCLLFFVGGQQLLERMNLSPFSSTVGLACGSSPFNDAMPPVNNSPIHPNWTPHNPHHPCFRGALSNTRWPVAQPVFLPVERSDVHFHRGCHHHPPPCHMSVYNCCTHVSHCGYSTFPKRPRLEGDQLLSMPENGTTKSAFKASWQTSQAYQTLPENGTTKSAFKASWQTSQAYHTALRRPRSPPPLVKTSQNGCHHRTSEVPHSGTETRKASLVRSSLVTASKSVSSTHNNGSVKESINYGDEAFGSHSTTLRESYTALCKDTSQCSSTTSFEPTKLGYSSVADKKSNTNGEEHRKVDNEIEKCNTSPHDNNQKDTPVSLNNVKKKCSEKRRCKQSNTTDTRKESYSIRSEEQPEHFTSFKAPDKALRCRTTQKHVEQECQKHSFAKPKEDSFVSRDNNQNGKHLSCDANVRQYTSVRKCCNVPQSSTEIPTRRQSMPQHHHSPRDYKEEFPVKTSGSLYERETNEENRKCPAMSPTEYQKCSTGLFKHSYQNKQFTTVPGDEITPCYPTPKAADHHRYDGSPFNSQAPHFGLQSKVPQLRRGRPRSKGLKDKTPWYNGVPIYSPTDGQSHLSNSISCDTPQCKHSMRNNDSDVFPVSSASDINNNSTTATDRMRYQPFVPNDSVNNFENELKIRRQAVDQPKKTMSLGGPHDRNTNTSIQSHDQQYQHTRNIGNIDQNRDQMVSSTQYQDLSRNHCQKPPSLSPIETINASTSCPAPKRKSPLAPSSDSTKFVTNLNELLKRRTASSQRQHSSNNFSFDEIQIQDATQFRNKPVSIQSPHCQEERQETTICQSKWNAKSFEGHQKPTNLEGDENRRRDTIGFPNEKPEVQSSHRHVAKGEPGRSVALRLSRPNCEEINSRDYKVMTSISSGKQESYIVENNVLNEQAADTIKTQPCYPSSCDVPLPSAEDELDNMDGGCGGYAIDHSSLPKIVAVHSIVKRGETVQEEESTLFSANDKKYWKDLLKKLTSELCDFRGEIELQHKPEMNPRVSETSTLRGLLEGSKVADAQKQNKVSPEDSNVAIPSKKDSSLQPESLNEAKMDENISQWAMWDYLSSPSTNLTVHVRNPTAYAETEKKTQLPRKKPTVAELSEKILGTRERIKKETIPWKKKLLHSLEAIFIKRLRKTEKETGQKADISFEEEKPKEESKEKKNGQKERRYSQGGKEKIAGPRHKQTTKKKL